MKKPGTTLVIVGFIVLLGVVLFTPTYNLLRGNVEQATVASDDNPIELEDSTVYAEGELVSDFPDVPIYPGSVVQKSGEVNSDGKYGYFATWKTTNKSFTTVAKYYLDEVKKRKWEIVHSPDTTGKTTDEYIGAKVNGKVVNIYIEQDTPSEGVEVRIDFPPEGQ